MIKKSTDKETWLEYMKQFKPTITEEEVDHILWTETCYPFSDEITLTQVEDFFKKHPYLK